MLLPNPDDASGSDERARAKDRNGSDLSAGKDRCRWGVGSSEDRRPTARVGQQAHRGRVLRGSVGQGDGTARPVPVEPTRDQDGSAAFTPWSGGGYPSAV